MIACRATAEQAKQRGERQWSGTAWLAFDMGVLLRLCLCKRKTIKGKDEKYFGWRR